MCSVIFQFFNVVLCLYEELALCFVRNIWSGKPPPQQYVLFFLLFTFKVASYSLRRFCARPSCPKKLNDKTIKNRFKKQTNKPRHNKRSNEKKNNNNFQQTAENHNDDTSATIKVYHEIPRGIFPTFPKSISPLSDQWDAGLLRSKPNLRHYGAIDSLLHLLIVDP